MDNLDAAVQEKIDNDQEFQSSLEGLADEDREARLTERTTEVRNQLYQDAIASAKKNEGIANDQRTRAEKAEGKLKHEKPTDGDGTTPKNEPTATDDERLSDSDMYALRHADVHPDDVEEVVKAAKVLGKTVNEALQDDMVKTIIERRVATRTSAEATDPGTPNGSPKQTTDAEVLKDFRDGKLPEPGSQEAEQLFRARRGISSK